MADDPEGFADVSGAVRVELPIDDVWRERCRVRLKAMHLTQEALAKHVGCSQGNVSQALSAKLSQQTSEFAHAISLALSVELPMDADMALVARELRERGEDEVARSLLHTMKVAIGIPTITPPKSGR